MNNAVVIERLMGILLGLEMNEELVAAAHISTAIDALSRKEGPTNQIPQVIRDCLARIVRDDLRVLAVKRMAAAVHQIDICYQPSGLLQRGWSRLLRENFRARRRV
jgi:hypothetical protein